MSNLNPSFKLKSDNINTEEKSSNSSDSNGICLDAHLCCITFETMTDPVIDNDGNTYERSAIQEWLKNNGTSPITRRIMNPSELRSNRAVLDAINELKYYKTKNIPIKCKSIQLQSSANDLGLCITRVEAKILLNENENDIKKAGRKLYLMSLKKAAITSVKPPTYQLTQEDYERIDEFFNEVMQEDQEYRDNQRINEFYAEFDNEFDEKQQENDLGNEVFFFGKYKGVTFEHVFEIDRSYCDWVLSLDRPSNHLQNFVDYVNLRYSNNLIDKNSSSNSGGSADTKSYANHHDDPVCIQNDEMEDLEWPPVLYTYPQVEKAPLSLSMNANSNTKQPICYNWKNTGSCKYGNTCQYSHETRSHFYDPYRTIDSSSNSSRSFKNRRSHNKHKGNDWRYKKKITRRSSYR